MRIYIQCHYADGSQILGNMDGQAVLNCKTAQSYKRTNVYKRLARIVGNPHWMKGRVAFATIVDEQGKILETYFTQPTGFPE